jgi:hypothetical protein
MWEPRRPTTLGPPRPVTGIALPFYLCCFIEEDGIHTLLEYNQSLERFRENGPTIFEIHIFLS